MFQLVAKGNYLFCFLAGTLGHWAPPPKKKKNYRPRKLFSSFVEVFLACRAARRPRKLQEMLGGDIMVILGRSIAPLRRARSWRSGRWIGGKRSIGGSVRRLRFGSVRFDLVLQEGKQRGSKKARGRGSKGEGKQKGTRATQRKPEGKPKEEGNQKGIQGEPIHRVKINSANRVRKRSLREMQKPNDPDKKNRRPNVFLQNESHGSFSQPEIKCGLHCVLECV